MAWKAGSGHIGGSFSCAEILTVLYYRVMNIDPLLADQPDRDIFILSKGHAAPALYVTLARRGFFDASLLATFRTKGSTLQGHPDMHRVPGVEISTGSLGMGISNGIGFCLGNRLQQRANRVYVLCGDGELDEGQCWEAFMSAAKYRLGNLIVLVDRNHVQLDGTTEEIMPLGNLRCALESLGWHVVSCDGHTVHDLIAAFAQVCTGGDRPHVIIAETVKGKGVSFMEGRNVWHGKSLSDEEYRMACEELEKGVAP